MLCPLRDVGGQHVTDGGPADRTELVDELLGAGLAAGDVVAGLEDGVALRRQTHLTADVAGHGSTLWLRCCIIVGCLQSCGSKQKQGFHINKLCTERQGTVDFDFTMLHLREKISQTIQF